MALQLNLIRPAPVPESLVISTIEPGVMLSDAVNKIHKAESHSPIITPAISPPKFVQEKPSQRMQRLTGSIGNTWESGMHPSCLGNYHLTTSSSMAIQGASIKAEFERKCQEVVYGTARVDLAQGQLVNLNQFSLAPMRPMGEYYVKFADGTYKVFSDTQMTNHVVGKFGKECGFQYLERMVADPMFTVYYTSPGLNSVILGYGHVPKEKLRP